MTASAVAILLALLSVPVLAAARSPRLAESLIRLPAAWRHVAVRRAGAARAATAGLWVAMWAAALGAVGEGTQKPGLGVAVGAVVGLIVGGAATVAMTLAIDGWRAREAGPAVVCPARNTSVSAADLPPPVFTPAFPDLLAAARLPSAWQRTESAMRWTRNVSATGFLVAVMLFRVATVRADSRLKTAVGLSALALVSVAIAAFGGLAWARRARERQILRSGADVSVAALCTAHGWTQGSLAAHELRRRWPGVPFFADDKDHRVRACLRGTVGPYELCVADERGTPPGRSSQLMREARQAVFVISLPGTRLPRLSVAPRDSRYLPHQRVNRTLELESFNRQHHVACADPAFASAVLTPRMMTVLMEQLPPGAQLVVAGDALAFIVPGRLRVGQLEATVSSLVEILRLMPAYLLRQHATGRVAVSRVQE